MLNSIFQRFKKSSYISLVFTILFNIPVAYWDMVQYATDTFDLFCQISLALVLTNLLFFLLALLPFIGPFLISILSLGATLSVYFLFSFGKTLDPGVVHDILTVEPALTLEYLSWKIIALIIVSLSFSYYLWEIVTKKKTILPVVLFFVCSVPGSYYALNDGKKVEVTITKYNPVNLLYSLQTLFKFYGPEHSKMYKKIDLTDRHKFTFVPQSDEPLIIVYVLGESMRGDINGLNGYHINNMPRLKQRRNLVSISKARSIATSTRESIPFMLTRALAGNEEQAQSEKGIVSIYKHLGFNTSWISNQGIFGTFELQYAANALEAEKVITQREIKRLLGQTRLYDEDVLKFAQKHLNSSPTDNHFLVYHMLGSHWHFEHRYPKDFPQIEPLQTEICTAKCPTDCNAEQLAGSYHNSVMYSDYVLDKLLSYLSDKNAIVFFSSDHGMSIGENGLVGNAARGENLPPEQLDIEIFFWGSDKFLKAHPNMLETIRRNSNEPYTNDKLFYTILDCTDVLTDLMIDNYSLCFNPKF